MTTRRAFCKTALAASVAAVAAPLSLSASEPAGKPGAGNKYLKKNARRVLIISFDGICIDGFKQANIPNIKSIMKNGAASLATRDVMPSVTLPNYTSILTGAGPEVHGVTDNGWLVDHYGIPAVERDEDGYFPSVFQVLKDNGVKSAFYWNWRPLINPYNPKVFDDTLYAENDEYLPLYERAFDYLKANADDPAVVFLYSVHTDHAGHHYNWMSPEYIRSIEEGDVEVGKLIEKLKAEGLYDDTHIMFISDHGGIGNGHGGVSEAEMIVPWMIQGPGIRKGFAIEEANNTVNTASTVLSLFGIEQPLCWTGEVPESIFEK